MLCLYGLLYNNHTFKLVPLQGSFSFLTVLSLFEVISANKINLHSLILSSYLFKTNLEYFSENFKIIKCSKLLLQGVAIVRMIKRIQKSFPEVPEIMR